MKKKKYEKDERLLNDIKNFYSQSSELTEIMKKIKFWRTIFIVATVISTLSIIGVLATVPGIAIGEKPFIQKIAYGIGAMAAIALPVMGTAIKKLFGFKKQVWTLFCGGNIIEQIYSLHFENTMKTQNLTDFEFIFTEKTTSIRKTYDSHTVFIANAPIPKLSNGISYIKFKYKQKDGIFQINEPIDFAVIKTRTVNGKTEEYEDITRVSSYKALYNSDLDKEFEGFRLRRGKPKKDAYQCESIALNDKYNLNADSTDIRAAKFLSPKVINDLVDKTDLSFYSTGLSGDFYTDFYFAPASILPIGEVSISSFGGIEKLFLHIHWKVLEDFDKFKDSMNIIRAFN
ncbi:hypothetical protein SCHIN_v1c09410 [Spiroplasma chinense]|uniref:DUF3137 domain-containing protein n=1 Tax=Spiroplasma chinense TaxID=216932 RepID=A0A5B9Y4W5_9MOLU|nr:hypothetical protein [Spiroplasma chinense]QEH62134.1 hypothetical protein SCHIN_v1c09410 [Spiroplasma chinense]